MKFGKLRAVYLDVVYRTLNSAIKPWFFLENEKFYSGKQVLDIGCGSGHWTKILAQKAGFVHGVDINRHLVEEAKILARNSRNVEFHQADAAKLPFLNNSFSFVLCSETLEHISQKKVPVVIKEIGRVLKPGGIAVITAPYEEGVRRIYPKLQKYDGHAVAGFNEDFFKKFKQFRVIDVGYRFGRQFETIRRIITKFRGEKRMAFLTYVLTPLMLLSFASRAPKNHSLGIVVTLRKA